MSTEEKPKEITELELQIKLNHKKKHLDWFDYQNRGGRFKDKTPEEVRTNREQILEEIKELEKKLSGLNISD